MVDDTSEEKQYFENVRQQLGLHELEADSDNISTFIDGEGAWVFELEWDDSLDEEELLEFLLTARRTESSLSLEASDSAFKIRFFRAGNSPSDATA